MILAALAAASVLATSPAPSPGGTGDVTVESGTLVYDATLKRYRIEGGAVLRRGVVVLRARAAELDPSTGEVTATGGVLLTDATRAVAAEGLRAVLDGPFEADGVVAFLKAGPVDLSQAADVEAARAVGVNRLSLSARAVRGGTGSRLWVSGARLTLCDCGPGVEPSWSFRAVEADVIPGERAILSWPVLYVRAPFTERSVPIFALPWLYVPLGDRQTGLLLPEITEQTGATGFAPTLPLFVTLGRSADLTLTPSFAFGKRRPAGDTAAAVRGPMARLELRWAPAAGVEGRAELLWVDDADREPLGASGQRFGLVLLHRQGGEERLALAADVSLTTDGVLHRDLTSDTLERKAPYRRSSLVAARRVGPALLEAGSAYLQPLQPDGASGPYGVAGADLPLADPLAWVSATVPALRLGPLVGSGRAGIVRFTPVRGGADLAGRPEVTRLDARLGLEVPFLVSDAVAIAPFLRAAAIAYPGTNAGDGGSGAIAWAVAGAAASSEVSRGYGTFRHTIGARAEWRLATAASGSAPAFPAYDALDRVADAAAAGGSFLTAAPAGRFHQLRLALDTRLSRAGTTLLHLAAGQDLDVDAGRAADAFVRGALVLGPVRADLTARFPGPGAPRRPSGGVGSFLDAFSELRASLSVGDPRGTGLHAGLVSIGTWAPGAELAGLDLLFDPRGDEVGPLSQASAGARLALGPALLGYDVLFPGRVGVPTAGCGDGRSQRAFELQQQVGSLSWDSPCRCFRAAVRVTLDACGNVSGVKGQLEVARLGERAAVR